MKIVIKEMRPQLAVVSYCRLVNQRIRFSESFLPISRWQSTRTAAGTGSLSSSSGKILVRQLRRRRTALAFIWRNKMPSTTTMVPRKVSTSSAMFRFSIIMPVLAVNARPFGTIHQGRASAGANKIVQRPRGTLSRLMATGCSRTSLSNRLFGRRHCQPMRRSNGVIPLKSKADRSTGSREYVTAIDADCSLLANGDAAGTADEAGTGKSSIDVLPAKPSRLSSAQLSPTC